MHDSHDDENAARIGFPMPPRDEHERTAITGWGDGERCRGVVRRPGFSLDDSHPLAFIRCTLLHNHLDACGQPSDHVHGSRETGKVHARWSAEFSRELCSRKDCNALADVTILAGDERQETTPGNPLVSVGCLAHFKEIVVAARDNPLATLVTVAPRYHHEGSAEHFEQVRDAIFLDARDAEETAPREGQRVMFQCREDAIDNPHHRPFVLGVFPREALDDDERDAIPESLDDAVPACRDEHSIDRVVSLCTRGDKHHGDHIAAAWNRDRPETFSIVARWPNDADKPRPELRAVRGARVELPTMPGEEWPRSPRDKRERDAIVLAHAVGEPTCDAMHTAVNSRGKKFGAVACSLPPGHDGDHVAATSLGDIVGRWSKSIATAPTSRPPKSLKDIDRDAAHIDRKLARVEMVGSALLLFSVSEPRDHDVCRSAAKDLLSDLDALEEQAHREINDDQDWERPEPFTFSGGDLSTLEDDDFVSCNCRKRPRNVGLAENLGHAIRLPPGVLSFGAIDARCKDCHAPLRNLLVCFGTPDGTLVKEISPRECAATLGAASISLRFATHPEMTREQYVAAIEAHAKAAGAKVASSASVNVESEYERTPARSTEVH